MTWIYLIKLSSKRRHQIPAICHHFPPSPSHLRYRSISVAPPCRDRNSQKAWQIRCKSTRTKLPQTLLFSFLLQPYWRAMSSTPLGCKISDSHCRSYEIQIMILKNNDDNNNNNLAKHKMKDSVISQRWIQAFQSSSSSVQQESLL